MKQKTETPGRTLKGLTTEVFKQASVDAPTSDSNAQPTRKFSRKILRKEKRKEKKQKKSHYFAGYVKKAEVVAVPEEPVTKKRKRPEKRKKVKSHAGNNSEFDPLEDPLEKELRYLEGKLGDDRAKLTKELERDGFDEEFMSFLDDIVPQRATKAKICEESDMELEYLEGKLGITGGMDKKFLKEMDAIGFGAKFLKFVDDIVPKTDEKHSEKIVPIAATEPVGKYVPPHLREKEDLSAEQKLNGLFNKVTEGNLEVIGNEIAQAAQDLHREQPGFQQVFAQLFVEAAISNPHMNVLITACYAAITCTTAVAVHISVASAVVAELARRIRRYLDTKEEPGITKNALIFVSILFYYGLLPASVPFGLFKALFADTPTDACIDLALSVLRYCGRTLRSQFAEDFKEILIFLSTNAAKHKNKDEGRVKWLLMDLEDLKNNKNMVSFTVMDRFEQTKSWLENCSLMRGKRVKEFALDLPFEFPEAAPEKWVVDPLSTGHMVTLAPRGREKTSPLWEEARRQGMNTDIRKASFVALMGAEDDTHATMRLSEICKGPKQIGDVCSVLFHCAVRAQENNPFFSLTMIGTCDKPGTWGKKFAHGFKQALTNHLAQVHVNNKLNACNLAHLFAAGVASEAVSFPLTHLRFLKFDQVGNSSPFAGVLGIFMQRLIERLLHLCEDLDGCFGSLRQYEDVREGVNVAVENLVAPRLKSVEDQMKLEIVRRALEGRE